MLHGVSSNYSRDLEISGVYKLALFVVLYGCKILSVNLREERGLRAFENRVLKENIWTFEG